jgi:hypothetical protein
MKTADQKHSLLPSKEKTTGVVFLALPTKAKDIIVFKDSL